MPLLPLVIPAINAVKRMISLPCQVPPAVLVETILIAGTKLFYSEQSPDLKHIIHKSTGRSWLCHAKAGFSDVYEGEPVLAADGTQLGWELLEAADMAAWYFFLAGITVEGLIDWTSAVYHDSKALCHKGGTYGWGNEPVTGQPADGSWANASWHSPSWPDVWGGGGVINVGGGWSGMVGGIGHIVNDLDQPLPGGFRIWDSRTNSVVAQTPPQNGPEEIAKAVMLWSPFHDGSGEGGTWDLQYSGTSDNPYDHAFVKGGYGYNVNFFKKQS